MEKTNEKSISKNNLKPILSVLLGTAFLIALVLAPDIYREYRFSRFSQQQKECFSQQIAYEKGVGEFLQANQGSLFSPGLVEESELTGKLLEKKLIATSPGCPAKGILRIGSLDMSGAYVVSCSIHGSHDRPADFKGMVSFKTAAGGTLIYDSRIVRDNADVMAAYLLSAGLLTNPATSMRADLVDGSMQISFKALIDRDRLPITTERLIFHGEEMATQIFNNQPVYFKLLPSDGGQPIIIKSPRPSAK